MGVADLREKNRDSRSWTLGHHRQGLHGLQNPQLVFVEVKFEVGLLKGPLLPKGVMPTSKVLDAIHFGPYWHAQDWGLDSALGAVESSQPCHLARQELACSDLQVEVVPESGHCEVARYGVLKRHLLYRPLPTHRSGSDAVVGTVYALEGH